MDESDSLDIEHHAELAVYLRRCGHVASDERLRCQNLRGGVSNRVVLVSREQGPDLVIKQSLPKLRVEADWFCDPARVHREAEGMSVLRKLTGNSCIPELLFEDEQAHLLAMTAVPQPHENWKTILLRGRVDDDHIRQFAAIIAKIHDRSWQHDDIRRRFDDWSFFEPLRLEPYYAYTAEQVSSARKFMTLLIEQTRAAHCCLVHGDYSPKNVLVYQDRLVLLDHEVIHFGDGTFDLGFAMTHLLSKAHHLPKNRQRFARAATLFHETYVREMKTTTIPESWEPRWVRHTLGCLLARVAGRSPLEYLTPAEKDRQCRVVLSLMEALPDTVPALVEQFVDRLSLDCTTCGWG